MMCPNLNTLIPCVCVCVVFLLYNEYIGCHVFAAKFKGENSALISTLHINEEQPIDSLKSKLNTIVINISLQ